MSWFFAVIAVVGCVAFPALAELNQQEFVEAVGLLGLDPDTFAAAGISETDLVETYQVITESDTTWAQVLSHRDTVRAALDSIGEEVGGESTDTVDSAKVAFNQALSSWRDAIITTVSFSVQMKLLLITSQASSGLPAYLLVNQWSVDELDILTKGFAEYSRQQRTGVQEESAAVGFYLNATANVEVIAAKANWDVRRGIYRQRFTEQFFELN